MIQIFSAPFSGCFYTVAGLQIVHKLFHTWYLNFWVLIGQAKHFLLFLFIWLDKCISKYDFEIISNFDFENSLSLNIHASRVWSNKCLWKAKSNGGQHSKSKFSYTCEQIFMIWFIAVLAQLSSSLNLQSCGN